jgi:hypothetical protein
MIMTEQLAEAEQEFLSRRFATIRQSMDFINENYAPMTRMMLKWRIKHAKFRVLRDGHTNLLIETQSIVDYYNRPRSESGGAAGATARHELAAE